MKTTSILMEEHRILRQVLQCLETLAGKIQRRGHLDEEAARQTLELLESFAGSRHQEKEEDLVRRAAELACRRGRSQLASLARRHENERALLGEMRAQLDRALAGDSWGFDLFVMRAREYVKLQRRHADMEDEELFPLLDEILSGRDETESLSDFERVEKHSLSPSKRSPERLVAELCRRVGLDTQGLGRGAELPRTPAQCPPYMVRRRPRQSA